MLNFSLVQPARSETFVVAYLAAVDSLTCATYAILDLSRFIMCNSSLRRDEESDVSFHLLQLPIGKVRFEWHLALAIHITRGVVEGVVGGIPIDMI